MNYFSYPTAAERYARGRPYFHPLVIERLIAFLGPKKPFSRALDVGCGVGHSTVPLETVARFIVGADLSAEMLGHAPREGNLQFVNALAEELPFAPSSFELITAGLAFHWFERDRFLREASRLLVAGGRLVIYTNWFTGRMLENPRFESWFRDEYQRRYPHPTGDRRPLEDAAAAAYGFTFERRENYENEVSFTSSSLLGYLLTRSDVIAAVEEGHESLAGVEAWITAALAPLFASENATFEFGGWIWYLRKTG